MRMCRLAPLLILAYTLATASSLACRPTQELVMRPLPTCRPTACGEACCRPEPVLTLAGAVNDACL